MSDKQAKLIKIADCKLNEVIRNNYREIESELPYDFDDLIKGDWQIAYNEHPEHYTVSTNVLNINFLHNQRIIITYTIYLDDNLQFVDEFFVTH